METNILVVDDETEIADLVELYLKNENYTIYKAESAKEAFHIVAKHPIQLTLLDVMLPDMDGFEICKKMRELYNFPIIMLTAKVDELDKVIGFNNGADDYITKPFNPIELVARVKAQIRRFMKYNLREGKQEEMIDFSGLMINKQTHLCQLYEKEIHLTPIEFDILWYLCQHKGKVIPTEELFEAVWKEKYWDANNTVMVHIRKIREKMGEPSKNPKFIKTVWGVGYKVDEK